MQFLALVQTIACLVVFLLSYQTLFFNSGWWFDDAVVWRPRWFLPWVEPVIDTRFIWFLASCSFPSLRIADLLYASVYCFCFSVFLGGCCSLGSFLVYYFRFLSDWFIRKLVLTIGKVIDFNLLCSVFSYVLFSWANSVTLKNTSVFCKVFS